MHLYVSDEYYPVRLCDEHSADLSLEKVKVKPTTYCDYCRFAAYNPGYTVLEYMQIYTAARQLTMHIKYIGHDWGTGQVWINSNWVRFGRGILYIRVWDKRGKDQWLESN